MTLINSKNVNKILFSICLLTIPFLILLLIFGIMVHNSDFSYQAILLLIIFPLLFLPITLFASLQILKATQAGKNLFKGQKIHIKTLYSLFFISCFLLMGFVVLISYSLANEKPPKFFPFDDPDAIYTVTKNNNRYFLSYKTTTDRNKWYTCSWEESGEKKCQYELNQNVETMIGESKVELEPLVGKRLRIAGDFVYGTKQCIAGRCQNIGNWAVLNLHSVEVLE